ncbi:MAG: dicarboxylate/amino acid:cation symporter [Methanosarcina sp.]
MKGKDRHYIPDPKRITNEIAEETKLLGREISEEITRIYTHDLRRNNYLKDLSRNLHDLLEKKLWLKILISMGLGILMGLFLGPLGGYVDPASAEILGEWIALPGYIFLALLKMIVIPLVFASIILGVASQNMGELKKTGLFTAIYFILTTAVATAIGLEMALFLKPGRFINGDLVENALGDGAQPVSTGLNYDPSALDLPSLLVGNIFPSNPLGAMVNGEMLQVVFLALIVGVALVSLDKEQSSPMVNFLNSVQSICMTVVKWSMALAPIAVFGLLTKFTIKLGLDALAGMAVYVGTVLASLALMMGFNLMIVFFVGRYNPLVFLKNIRDVLLLAFSTSSSAAVMPLTLKTAQENLGVRPSISQFVIPLGATVNMNGTALYQGVATVFLAEVFGINLGSAELLMVMVLAVAASIGTPSIPGVGIIVLAMILNSVGVPTSGIALIMGVDRILDMTRTAVNVAGDLVTCKVMDRLLPEKSPEEKEAAQTISEGTLESKLEKEPVGEKVKAGSDPAMLKMPPL